MMAHKATAVYTGMPTKQTAHIDYRSQLYIPGCQTFSPSPTTLLTPSSIHTIMTNQNPHSAKIQIFVKKISNNKNNM